MKNFKIYILILTVCLISKVSLYADEKRIPVCTNSGNVYLPSSEKSIMFGKENGTFVCWLEESNNGCLKVQKIDEFGNLLWAANGVSVDTELGSGFTSDSDYPLLFSDNEGGVVCIFRKISTDREDIYMSRIFRTGEVLFTPVCLSASYGGYNYSPVAAVLSNNDVAIAWENFSEGDFNIHAQLINTKGSKLWNRGNELKVCDENNDQRKPAVAVSANNVILLTWLDSRHNQEYRFDLYGKMLDPEGRSLVDIKNGSLIFKNINQVNSRKPVFYNHRMVSSDKNSFIMALEHSNDLLFSNIIVLKVNERLEKEWSIDLQNGSPQSNPLITGDGSYGAGIIWNESKENYNDIFGIIADKDGNVIWGDKKGKKIGIDGMKEPSERMLTSEKNTNGFCIYQNKLFLNWVNTGANKLFLNEINLADESGQCNTALELQDEISEGEYTSITAQRNSIVAVYKQSNSIFATVRNLSEKGFLQAVQKPALDNFPNPFNPSTKINFSIPSEGFVRLSVFDLTGRLIETLMNEYKNAGEHSVVFDGSNLSSGVYFYRLEVNGAALTKRMTMLK
ncbi:MAG: T9SS type A sorting domain-containing protein [Ignavibacteria bacterium]|nr:T9SS type A sorting domain-containing protein [Ignavibacteria bacterium]